MEQFAEGESTREEIKNKLRQNFDGKIVRKDLTKKIKEGANVPVYVLEFLLGQYCSSDDETVIEKGVQNVKRILADNFVRPDESQKILSQLRKKGSHTIIDMVTVRLDMKKDCFFAELHGIWLFCPWQRRKSCYCVHGICGKYQSECGRAVENIQSVCTFPAGNGNRYSIS